MHYHYTLLALHFFLFSINYMVKFACFRAFSLEIKILLLPFYFEFLVLQECKVVFRKCITLEHKQLQYIYIYCPYLKVNIFPLVFRNMYGILDLYPWFVVQKWLGKYFYDLSFFEQKITIASPCWSSFYLAILILCTFIQIIIFGK